jgi:AraC family transcriptional regulator
MTGEGPAQHARRLRLERAALELRWTDKPADRIAAEHGYGHRESFIRAFRAHFGAAPAAFRAPRRATNHGWPLRRRPGEPLSRAPRVCVDNFPALHLAFVRRIGNRDVPHEEFPRLVEWATARLRAAPADILCLGVVHDDPTITPGPRRRFDACIAVPPSVRPQGDIGVQVIGGGEYGVGRGRPGEASRRRVARLCTYGLRRRLRAAPVIEVYLGNPAAGRPLADVLVPVETLRPTKRWYFRRARSTTRTEPIG